MTTDKTGTAEIPWDSVYGELQAAPTHIYTRINESEFLSSHIIPEKFSWLQKVSLS